MGKDEDQMRVGMIALKSSRLRAAKYARKERPVGTRVFLKHRSAT